MQTIKPSRNAMQWPRNKVASVECRKQDLVVRITDWTKDRDEPGYDVEVYIGGVYDWNESETFTLYEHKTKETAKSLAMAFAQFQIGKLL